VVVEKGSQGEYSRGVARDFRTVWGNSISYFLAMGATAKYTYTGPLGGLNESWQEALERHVRLWPQADDRSHASLRRCLDEWCEQQ